MQNGVESIDAQAPRWRRGPAAGREYGCPKGRAITSDHPAEDEPGVASADEREPLPPGHPVSWGALTAGTLLEGVPYPLPVFDR